MIILDVLGVRCYDLLELLFYCLFCLVMVIFIWLLVFTCSGLLAKSHERYLSVISCYVIGVVAMCI